MSDVSIAVSQMASERNSRRSLYRDIRQQIHLDQQLFAMGVAFEVIRRSSPLIIFGNWAKEPDACWAPETTDECGSRLHWPPSYPAFFLCWKRSVRLDGFTKLFPEKILRKVKLHLRYSRSRGPVRERDVRQGRRRGGAAHG